MQDSFGGTTTYVYDRDDRLSRVQFGGSGLTPLRYEQTYNADGELASQTRYSNLAGTTVVRTTL